MPNARTEDNIFTNKVKQRLYVPLDSLREKEVTEALLSGLDAIEELERKKKAISDEIKEELERLESNVKTARKAIKEGELDDVMVEVSKNYTTGTVTEVRLDTGEVISERVMNEEERKTPPSPATVGRP